MIKILIGFICVAVFVFGIIWNFRLISADEKTNFSRLKFPIYFGGFLLIGSLGWNFLAWIDASYEGEGLVFVLAALGLAIVFIVKQYLGPTLIGATVAWAIYCGFQYEVFALLPIFEFVTESLLYTSPKWVKQIYMAYSVIVTFGYTIFFSRDEQTITSFFGSDW